jgi:4-hydroxymandelate oxidase
VEDFEAAARERLPGMVYDYYAGGAGEEWTLRENRRAFDRWTIRPRVLVDVSKVDASAAVLGEPTSFPIMLAPTAFHRMAHPDGELAVARAAGGTGTVMTLSSISTTSLEDVAEAGRPGPQWFQLYVLRRREIAERLVHRAHDAGYRAIVLTVDAPLLGRRPRDERNQFTLPQGIGLANLAGMALPAPATGSGLFAYFATEIEASLSWADLEWLRSLSPLPLVVKGILRGDDAERAVDAGADAIVVSNHGGRQLDGAPATLDVLPEVVEAVRGRIEVYLDGGVRRGTDVLKALALGARAVLIGRPYLWGLAAGGEAGVRRVIESLRNDLILAMQLAGLPRLDAIDRSAVAPAL